MNDQDSRSARLRYTATGALATLAVVGAIAGTAALGARPRAKPPRRAAVVANCGTSKTPSTAPDGPGKAGAPEQSASPQPFLTDIQRLVGNGTITAAEGRVVDREILAGRIDTDTLAASGFTQAQLQAVNQALSSTKRGLATAAHGTSK